MKSSFKLPALLIRHGIGYGLVGALALCIDWGVFVAATALGAATVPANLLARMVGACVAYALNGAFTFRHEGRPRLGWTRFGRYAVTWVAMTFVSSVAMAWTQGQAGMEAAWLAKPVVELALAVVVFLVYRYWIFR